MLATAVCALRLPLNTQARAALLVLAPSVAGAVHAAMLLVTELTWPRPEGALRSAVVARRAVRDIRPRALSAVLAGLTAALAAGVVTAGLLADDDGLSITRRTATHAETASPFPGC